MDAAWIAVIGTLGGSALTTASALIGSWIKTKADKKAREWILEDEELKRAIHQREEEFSVYNEVLRADGESTIIRIGESGMGEFKTKEYKESVRPIFYKNLHLLPSNIRMQLRQLDELINEDISSYNGYDDWREVLYGNYLNLIRYVEAKYEEIQ